MRYSIFSLISLFLLLGTGRNSVQAQTITPSITGAVETCTNQTYTVTGFTLPQGAVFKSYKWTVSFNAPSVNSPLSPSCGGTINGTVQGSFTSTKIGENSINVIWGDFFAPKTCEVEVVITYSITTPATTTTPAKTTDYPFTYPTNVNVLGVCPGLFITGPNSIQKCCTTPVVYTVNNFGNCESWNTAGFNFAWTVTGGTIQGVQNTATITVVPSTNSNVVATCKVSRPASGGGTNRIATFTSTRFNPTISVAAVNGQSNLCPGTIVDFNSSASSCGLNTINWSIPNTWQTISNSNGTIKATVGGIGSSGNIVATATYNGGCVATTSIPVSVLSGAPKPPELKWDDNSGDYTYFHCGEWFFCPQDGEAQMTAFVKAGTTDIVWKISPPWRFNGGGQVFKQHLNVTFDQFVFSPNIEADCKVQTDGVLEVSSINCLGNSSDSQRFYRDVSGWCNRDCHHTCYPSEEPCLGVSEEYKCEGPFEKTSSNTNTKQDVLEAEEVFESKVSKSFITNGLTIFPNPANEQLTIVSEENIKDLKIIDISGRVMLLQQNIDAKQVRLELNNIPQGLYFIEANLGSHKTMQKVVVSHN
jgi:hypothetical protein